MHFVVFLTGFGSNDDDTACSGSTVDTGRTCILEDGDGLYVIGVEGTTHDTINYVNRVGPGGNRTCSTDTDLRRITRLTSCVRNR